jgi:hypothetical protein
MSGIKNGFVFFNSAKDRIAECLEILKRVGIVYSHSGTYGGAWSLSLFVNQPLS